MTTRRLLAAAALALAAVVCLHADTPPTVSSFVNSTLTGAAASEVTASTSWNSGDVVLVVGYTDDNANTLGVPTTTGTGLTFTQKVTTAGVNGADCKAYAWAATASATSSGTISSTASGSIHAAIGAFVFAGSAGTGATANGTNLSTNTAPVLSLVRANNNSAVVIAFCDFNAVNDVAVTTTPATGSTQRIASNDSTFLTGFVVSWTDQGAAATTSYGLASAAGAGTADWSGIAIEIKGTAVAGGCTDSHLLGVWRCDEAAP
jgi:hypothetical protein